MYKLLRSRTVAAVALEPRRWWLGDGCQTLVVIVVVVVVVVRTVMRAGRLLVAAPRETKSWEEARSKAQRWGPQQLYHTSSRPCKENPRTDPDLLVRSTSSSTRKTGKRNSADAGAAGPGLLSRLRLEEPVLLLALSRPFAFVPGLVGRLPAVSLLACPFLHSPEQSQAEAEVKAIPVTPSHASIQPSTCHPTSRHPDTHSYFPPSLVPSGRRSKPGGARRWSLVALLQWKRRRFDCGCNAALCSLAA